MAKILLAEDDNALNASVCDLLRAERHTVESVFDGASALELIDTYDYDILILDIGLPNVDGLEICKQVRAANRGCGILMLTGRGEVAQKMEGLDSGADDYLTKPFDSRELSARIRALLRRSDGPALRNIIAIGGVELDLTSRKVSRSGAEVHLTPKEFALLEFMMRHKGQVFNPNALITRVWPADDETSGEMIRSYIKNLRKKLDTEGQPSIFRTVHKIGYVVDDVS